MFNLTKEQERWVVGIMLSVTLVKLVLMIYCRAFTNEIIKAYAQDHFFDVVTNAIGLVAALLANYIHGWMDPLGAIIVSRNSLSPDCLPILNRLAVVCLPLVCIFYEFENSFGSISSLVPGLSDLCLLDTFESSGTK